MAPELTQSLFAKGERVMVINGERLAEIGTFAYYGESGTCYVRFIDGAELGYAEGQIKPFAN